MATVDVSGGVVTVNAGVAAFSVNETPDGEIEAVSCAA